MYNVRDYIHGNERIRRNLDMISMKDSYHFTVTSVLHTAKHGLRYHQQADPPLIHPTYGLISPVSLPIIHFFTHYEIVRLL